MDGTSYLFRRSQVFYQTNKTEWAVVDRESSNPEVEGSTPTGKSVFANFLRS